MVALQANLVHLGEGGFAFAERDDFCAALVEVIKAELHALNGFVAEWALFKAEGNNGGVAAWTSHKGESGLPPVTVGAHIR